MTAAEDSTAVKKRIMFIQGEDFNYLAYHVLIILDALKCNSANKPLKDHRKLAFMIDIVSSPTLAPMLARRARLDSRLSVRDLHSLAIAYSNGASRKHLVTRIVSSLVTRGLLAVQKADRDLELNVWLNREKIPQAFLTSDLYKNERDNLKLLQGISSQLRALTLETFLKKFFDENGVQTWHS